MNKNQRGFGVIPIIIIVAVLGIIGFAGWYIWQLKNNNPASKTEQTSQSNLSQQKKQTEVANSILILERNGIKISAPLIPKGWKTSSCDEQYILFYQPTKTTVVCGTDGTGSIMAVGIVKSADYDNKATNCEEAKVASTAKSSVDEDWFVSYDCEDLKLSGLSAFKEVTVLNENAPFGASTTTSYVVRPTKTTVVSLAFTDPNNGANLNDTQTFNNFVKTLKIEY